MNQNTKRNFAVFGLGGLLYVGAIAYYKQHVENNNPDILHNGVRVQTIVSRYNQAARDSFYAGEQV